MKIKSLLIIIQFTLFISQLFAQCELYIPRNIRPAYEKGTRSFNGQPGVEYWQNSSEYKINVEVNPSNYFIKGNEKITYHNNSPDTLKSLVLRLYPNIYKKGSARDFSVSPEAVNDGMIIENLIVGENKIDLEDNNIYINQNTISIIKLSDFIPPESSVNISINWNFYMTPKTRLRMGVYDSTTVLVGYWYPQVAVYDDVDGWDFNNYSGQVEFYNDFSNFDVSVTLPNNFGVWGTGQLLNPEEVYSEKIYQKYLEANESDTVIHIISSNDFTTSFKNKNDKNIWKFNAENVSDFAFALSDHYLWKISGSLRQRMFQILLLHLVIIICGMVLQLN
ncbi:MAG: hypothetical protein P8X47_13130 [Ignavibacteriaceae bacterium]